MVVSPSHTSHINKEYVGACEPMFTVFIMPPQILADRPIIVRAERGKKTQCATATIAFYYTELVAATPTATAMSLSSSAQDNDSVIP
jgi:hypothetical protein